MSDYLESVRQALAFYGDPDSYTGHERSVLDAARRLVRLAETGPDYEAAYDKASEEIGLPVTVNVNTYLTDGLEGEERKQALERLKAADAEAEQANRDIIKSIVDAALADYLTEEETDGR